MSTIVLSRLFLANLQDILSYIEKDNGKSSSNQVEDMIMRSIDLLQYFPLIGKEIANTEGEVIAHLLTVSNYRIIYSYYSDTVYIEDIYDSRRKYHFRKA